MLIGVFKQFSICVRFIGPGLKIAGEFPERSNTVDSSPKEQGPPSKMGGDWRPKLLNTCSAVVGLTLFDLFALGAARGAFTNERTSLNLEWDGERTATVSKSAQTLDGTHSLFFKITVIGPGQNSSNIEHA